MLYREIIAVCSEIHTKHINTLCGQNGELLNVKPSATFSDQWPLNFALEQTTKAQRRSRCIALLFL